MRALFRILVISITLLVIGFYINIFQKDDKNIVMKKNFFKQTNQNFPRNQQNKEERPLTEKPKEGLSLLIGQDVESLEKQLGKPQRIDQTIYGYEWFVYNRNAKRYVQVGVEDNHVVTVYAMGDNLNIAPFEIGQPVEEIFNTQYIDANVDIHLGGNTYRFELNDTDINLRPLIQLGDLYVQLYFDKYSGELSSVRFLNAETLVKQRPYELVYHGDLIEPPVPDETLRERADQGNVKEIFDLTNVLRVRNGLNRLQWDEKTAETAFEHSKDMYQTSDFSHSSTRYGSLSDRLKNAKVGYQTAGENIAANYTDGPAVVAGWLNSQSHRESLFNKNFTHTGIGVYKEYFTQDLIQRTK